jgi:hypothetical protein
MNTKRVRGIVLNPNEGLRVFRFKNPAMSLHNLNTSESAPASIKIEKRTRGDPNLPYLAKMKIKA